MGASFHIIIPHSTRVYHLGMKFDFQGVILLMWSANIPMIYYSFICDPQIQLIHWTLTTVLALCCSIATFQPRFSEPHLRPLRAGTFSSLALSTFIPVFHGIIKYGYLAQRERICLSWVLLTLALNGTGAVAYASKVKTYQEQALPRPLRR
jgi:adiponectin receptor